MFFVSIEVSDSNIHGYGVFSKEPVRKGEIIAVILCNISKIIDKKQFIKARNEQNKDILSNGIRYIYDYFVFDDYIANGLNFGHNKYDYINHSFNPTMIYHCGMCFAKRDLKNGEELTVDYRYICPEEEVMTDFTTGIKFRGFSGKIAFQKSLTELYEILYPLQIQC